MWRSQHWGLEWTSYFTPDSAFTLGRTPQEGGGQAHRSEGQRMGCWNRGWQWFFLLSQNCSQGPKLRIPSTEGLWSELRNLPGGPAPPHRLRKGLPPTKCQVPCPLTHWWCWKVPEARAVGGWSPLLQPGRGTVYSSGRLVAWPRLGGCSEPQTQSQPWGCCCCCCCWRYSKRNPGAPWQQVSDASPPAPNGGKKRMSGRFLWPPRSVSRSALEISEGRSLARRAPDNRGCVSARKMGQSTPSRSSAPGRAQMDKLGLESKNWGV